jgi:hypothetical protein
MQKRHAMPAGAGARLFIQQSHPGRGQTLQRALEISHPVSNMVEAGTALIEEPLHGGISAGGLQQFNFARPRTDKCDVDLLSFDALDPGTGSAGQEFEYGQRGGNRRDRNRDMI